MQTQLSKKLGVEYPIFAFTHCRDVVVAVSNAGGFGVLGAVGFSPEQLEIELSWIDDHIGDKPYGLDIVIPARYEGREEKDPAKLLALIQARIPQTHRDFAKKLLDDHGVPKLPAGTVTKDRLVMTESTSVPLVAVALEHEKVRLVANALGTPPADVVKQIQESGRMVGALCGSARHARRNLDAGLDFIIAQGCEGGGHTGEVGSIVLWPEVINEAGNTPVLAAGGIGTGGQIASALAMGAQGVWCGSIWLTVHESDAPAARKQSLLDAGTRDTVRSRSFTGKPVRMLRNAWTDAWDSEGNPSSLSAPLQAMVAGEAMHRANRYPDKSQDVCCSPVGQIVGRMNQAQSSRHVLMKMVEEYLDAVERLTLLQSGEE